MYHMQLKPTSEQMITSVIQANSASSYMNTQLRAPLSLFLKEMWIETRWMLKSRDDVSLFILFYIDTAS